MGVGVGKGVAVFSGVAVAVGVAVFSGVAVRVAVGVASGVCVQVGVKVISGVEVASWIILIPSPASPPPLNMQPASERHANTRRVK